MTPTEEICARLDELGVEYDTYDLPNGEHGLSWIDSNDIEWEVVQQGENFRIHALQLVTPEQAIAATVGERNPDGLPIGLTISNDGNLLNWMGENYVRQDAATVGTEPDEATMLKLHDRMNAALLDYKSAMGIDGWANTVPFVNEMHQIIEDAATVGAGTCHCTTPDDAWCFSCSSCGKSFPRSELNMAHNHGEINYCPNCGRIIKEESE